MNIYKNEKYTDFINEMGGWEDFLGYYDAVSKNRDTENPEPGIVRHITRAKAFLSKINLLINGILNANVFPVPVCAVPKISLPSNAAGIAIPCIGVGLVKFILCNEFFNESSIFNNLKFSIY